MDRFATSPADLSASPARHLRRQPEVAKQSLRPGTASRRSSPRLSGLDPGRPRIALMVVLVAAAFPYRIANSVAVVDSFSVLDVVLVVVAFTLILDLAFRPIDIGPRPLFWLLCVPAVVSGASLAWSHDHAATLRATLVYVEGLIIYLFVIRELDGVPAARVITYIKRYTYLVIIPAILLILHVPGFAPEVEFGHSNGAYLTYFTRLSHPVIGASNNLATVLAFFVPLLLYWGHSRHDRRASIAGFVALAAIFLTLSRGILLSFVIAGALYWVFASGRRTLRAPGLGRKVVAGVTIGAVAIVVLYNLNPSTKDSFASRYGTQNIQIRGELLSYALAEIAKSPVLGYGSAASPQLRGIDFHPNSAGSALNCAGCPAPNTAVLYPLKVDSHNTYLQQALYFGLPLGLLVSLALWGTVAVFLTRRRSAALAGVIAYTIIVQLVSYLFEASFEGTLLRILFYLSIGLAAALLRADEEAIAAIPHRARGPLPWAGRRADAREATEAHEDATDSTGTRRSRGRLA